jgi:hypothetical protein
MRLEHTVKMFTKGLHTFEMRPKTNAVSLIFTPALVDKEILFQMTRVIVIMRPCR